MPTTVALSRDRVCLLAGVERARHRRWQNKGLLRKRTRYSMLDVVRAATLDELWSKLGPSAAEAAWGQVSADIGVPGAKDVIVNLATHEAGLAQTPDELHRGVWRGAQIMVIDVGTRAHAAQTAVRSFCARTKPASQQKPTRRAREEMVG